MAIGRGTAISNKPMTADVRIPLKTSLRDPHRSLDAPRVPEANRTVHSVSKGFISSIGSGHSESFESAPPMASTSLLPVMSVSGLASKASESSNSTSTFISNIAAPSLQAVMSDLSRKRALESLPQHPAKKARKHRTCRKCGRDGCPGSQKVENCTNPCQDCGKARGCRGRNTKRPGKTCQTGWVDND